MNFKQISFTLVIFAFNLFYLSDGKRSIYDLKLDSINCSDSGLYGKMECGVDEISSTVTHIQLNFTATKEFNPLVRIAFFYRYSNGRNFLLDVTEDFCAFIRDDQPARVINFFWPSLKDASNFGEGCPFQKDHRYFIKDYALDMSSFPPILPTGNYRVDIGLMDRAANESIALVQLYAYIKRKSIAELLWS